MVLIDWFLFLFMTAFKDCSICFCPHWLLLQLEKHWEREEDLLLRASETKGQDTHPPAGPTRGQNTDFPQCIFDSTDLFPALNRFPLDSCRSNWPPAYLVFSPRSSSKANLLPCLMWLPQDLLSYPPPPSHSILYPWTSLMFFFLQSYLKCLTTMPSARGPVHSTLRAQPRKQEFLEMFWSLLVRPGA